MSDGPLHDWLISGPLTVPVEGCARCGGVHPEVTFEPLAIPMEIGDPTGQDPERTLTHWASCPTNGEPILLHVETDA